MINDTPKQNGSKHIVVKQEKTKSPATYDGGFHVRFEPEQEKRKVNKRSSLQSFTCK